MTDPAPEQEAADRTKAEGWLAALRAILYADQTPPTGVARAMATLEEVKEEHPAAAFARASMATLRKRIQSEPDKAAALCTAETWTEVIAVIDASKKDDAALFLWIEGALQEAFRINFGDADAMHAAHEKFCAQLKAQRRAQFAEFLFQSMTWMDAATSETAIQKLRDASATLEFGEDISDIIDLVASARQGATA